MTVPHLALALDGPQLVELTASARHTRRWDALPVAYSVLGLDRIDGRATATVTLDGSSVGAALARRTSHGRFLVATSPQRDHPYNLARRIVSLAHLSRGRSGVLLGLRDAYAAAGPGTDGAWGGAGLGGGAPLTVATAHDAARAVRALEQSWPFDSIVGDRGTGILVRSDRIVHVDQEGAFRIEGPLNAPEAPTGASVLGWYAGSAATSADPGVFDVVLGHGGVPVVGPGEELPGGDTGGVLLRAVGEPLDQVLDEAERLLASGRVRATELGGTLRSALELGPAVPRCDGARVAFPAPQPHPSL